MVAQREISGDHQSQQASYSGDRGSEQNVTAIHLMVDSLFKYFTSDRHAKYLLAPDIFSFIFSSYQI